MSESDDLIEALLAGEHRALARVITKIEDRRPGYRDIVAQLHEHTGDAEVIGVTGSPGAGKSTLVDKLAASYREQGLTVGVIAVDPSSPFSGGAVLGDRIRMASNVGDMDVFVRSMSARGTLGGLSTATSDAIKALDAFGKDRVIIETVGAGQNEVDVVRTADTVAVLVQPGSGDDIQMLKAGILEIGDVFVVNKADMDGADRTVQQLREMIQQNQGDYERSTAGHHGAEAGVAGPQADAAGGVGTDADATGGEGPHADATSGEGPHADATSGEGPHADDAGGTGHPGGAAGDGASAGAEVAGRWVPEVVETVATTGEGVDELIAALADHRAFLESSGRLEEKTRTRYAEELWTLVRDDLGDLVAEEVAARGGLDEVVEAVARRETDPYTLADDIVAPIAECVEERDDRD